MGVPGLDGRPQGLAESIASLGGGGSWGIDVLEDRQDGDWLIVHEASYNEALGIRDRHIIGVDQLLWGGDYPHQESTCPRSLQIIEEILPDCTEEEKAKIAGGNAARVYNLN